MISRSSSVISSVAAACLAAAGGALAASDEAASRSGQVGAPVRVELLASSKEYVLGQPIRLTLVVTNQRDTPIRFRKVNIEIGEPLLLYVSTDGKEFVEWKEGRGSIPNFGTVADTLAAGASRKYSLRILYSVWTPQKLTFPQPGRYWIRLDFPFMLGGTSKNVFLPSNAVEVRITEPTGVDAAMWDVLRQEAYIGLLYADGAPPAAVRKVLELLKTHQKSGYHADLNASLAAYYDRLTKYGMADVQANPEGKAVVEELRQRLGIPDPDTLPFPDDKRLNAKFTTSFEGGATFAAVFRRVSELTKVRFSVAPDFADRIMYGGWRERELRAFLRERATDERHWIRDGDGYKLVPRSREKSKPKDSP